tara:strand:- start:409 stop:579 length:171 start_codon:yes stop_codon:yes gene_type:complete
MKTIYCRDAGFDCDAVIKAESDQEVLNLAAIHVKEVHGVTPNPEISEDLALLINEE